jgi:hypothetical protein
MMKNDEYTQYFLALDVNFSMLTNRFSDRIILLKLPSGFFEGNTSIKNEWMYSNCLPYHNRIRN